MLRVFILLHEYEVEKFFGLNGADDDILLTRLDCLNHHPFCVDEINTTLCC